MCEGQRSDETPRTSRDAEETLTAIVRHFQEHVQERFRTLGLPVPTELPDAAALKASRYQPGWLPIEGRHGEISFQLQGSGSFLRLISSSWVGLFDEGQTHIITRSGKRLVRQQGHLYQSDRIIRRREPRESVAEISLTDYLARLRSKGRPGEEYVRIVLESLAGTELSHEGVWNSLANAGHRLPGPQVWRLLSVLEANGLILGNDRSVDHSAWESSGDS